MATTSTTTLKLPQALKARLARVARKRGRTAHGFMLEALERHTAFEERMEAFVREAIAADRTVDETGEVYAATDVHRWLAQLAVGAKVRKPRPWRE
jgi:predicted transcriptional regulator